MRSAKHNQVANQKIHQMSSGQLRQMLAYKGGMPVVLQKERYTSQKCLRGTDRISNVAWEVGAILQPEKESL